MIKFKHFAGGVYNLEKINEHLFRVFDDAGTVDVTYRDDEVLHSFIRKTWIILDD